MINMRCDDLWIGVYGYAFPGNLVNEYLGNLVNEYRLEIRFQKDPS